MYTVIRLDVYRIRTGTYNQSFPPQKNHFSKYNDYVISYLPKFFYLHILRTISYCLYVPLSCKQYLWEVCYFSFDTLNHCEVVINCSISYKFLLFLYMFENVWIWTVLGREVRNELSFTIVSYYLWTVLIYIKNLYVETEKFIFLQSILYIY